MPTQAIKWRPYQQKAVQAPIDWYRLGKRQTVIGLPTGAGKTLISGGIIQQFLPRWSYALVVVPRLDLVKQTYEKYLQFFFEPEEVGVIQGTTNELGRRITIASKDTLDSSYRLQQYLDTVGGHQRVDVVAFDEAHLTVTDQYRKIKEAVLSPHGLFFGMSATPYRADGQSLAKMFPDGLCSTEDIWDLIHDGYLADIESLDIDMGFDPDELMIAGTKHKGKILDRVKALMRYAKAYDAWWHLARTKRTLVFAQNLEDATGFHEYFSEKGVVCHVITGRMDTAERNPLYDEFAAGRVQMLINYNVMTTGNDIAEIECLIMGRTTDNIGLVTQMIGRGLRLAPHIGKEKCLILNLTSKRHILVTAKELFGTTSDHVPSIRALISEKKEKEKKQFIEREEEEKQYQISIQLGQVTAHRYNMLIGDGWKEQPVIGDWVKEWTLRGKSHQLVAEKAFAGGYQPVYIDAKGHRHVLSGELLTLPDAQRACQQFASEQEQKAANRDRTPSPERLREPISDRQFAHLVQRNVCMKNAAGKTFRTMTEQEKAEVKAKITFGEYIRIARHMEMYGSPYSKLGGFIGWFEKSGVEVWNKPK